MWGLLPSCPCRCWPCSRCDCPLHTPAAPAAASHRPLGIEGWRVAFVSLAATSAAAGAANLLLAEDPRRVAAQKQAAQRAQRVLRTLSGSKLVDEAGGAVAPEPSGPRDAEAQALLQPPTPPEPLPPPAGLAESAGALGEAKQGLAIGQLQGVLREVGAVLSVRTFQLIVAQVREGASGSGRAGPAFGVPACQVPCPLTSPAPSLPILPPHRASVGASLGRRLYSSPSTSNSRA